MSDKAEQLRTLVKKAGEHCEAREEDQARQCIDEIFALDPENLDAHFLLAYLTPGFKEDAIEHIKFILDRDIKFYSTAGIYDRFIERFMLTLHMMASERRDNGHDRQAANETIVDYSTRLLQAGRSIDDCLNYFAEALEHLGRYEDLINLGLCADKAIDPASVGWPGLAHTHDFHGTDEITNHVLKAFFQTRRYEEACVWIHSRVKKKPEDWLLWRKLGEVLCWVGYPEETARAWIIAGRKRKCSEDLHDEFDDLTRAVYNPDSPAVQHLAYRLYTIRDEIPPEKKQEFEDICVSVNVILNGDRDSKPPTETYIERKLGMKLPDVRRVRELWLAKTRSKHPVIQEVIATLDAMAATFQAEAAQRIDAKPTLKQEREKVAVGVGAGPNPSQQGFALYQFGIDVTEQARRGEMPPIVGRDREIERMVRILARQEKNNPILLGEAGVGKTAVVHGLAQRIVAGQVPPVLKDRRVIELNMGVLVAGTTFRGDFEQRINDIVKATRDDPQIILFIDELHTLIGAGAGQAFDLDASNIIKPALANGELRLIGATTAQEFSRSIEKDAALERRFSPIWINEIDRDMTLSVLQARRTRWEQHHGIRIDENLLPVAVQLTDQHVRHRHFPDKAIDLVDEACAMVRTEAAADHREDRTGEPQKLTLAHLQRVVDQWTGSAGPAAGEGQRSGGLLDEIVEQLRQHVVGHEKVLQQLSTLVAAHKLGLRVSRLPRVLLFVGQAGSGKSETARTLAKLLWPGEKERFLRIDMSLYADPSHLSRLIGVPPGYAGGNESGLLALHLRQHPHSVIYLHNFHTAHMHVVQLFATLFAEGSVPDARGQSMFATGTIFILSATVDDQAGQIGFGVNRPAPNDEREMSDFLDRLELPDQILDAAADRYWFGELNEAQTHELVRRQLDKITQQPNLRDAGIKFDDEILKRLVARYRKEPPSVRNLKSLLNQIAFPYVRASAST
jgi:ATP-dependent Clp protease ATP-binding subunit ClpC